MVECLRMQPPTPPSLEFAADRVWLALARDSQVRLPPRHIPWTTARARRWLRRLAIPHATYLQWTGYRALSDFGALNPDWDLRAWVGVLLEWRTEAAQPERFHTLLAASTPERALASP
jgi:hypothetical protein